MLAPDWLGPILTGITTGQCTWHIAWAIRQNLVGRHTSDNGSRNVRSQHKQIGSYLEDRIETKWEPCIGFQNSDQAYSTWESARP